MSTGIGRDTKQSFYQLLQALKRDRERLGVQLNLGKRELKDEWDIVEKKWELLERHLSEFTDDAREMAHKVSEEIEEAYRGFRPKPKDNEKD